MVIVTQKFNNMPVGSTVKDVDFPKDGVFHVTSQPRTTRWGTEIGLVDDAGHLFYDNPRYYATFV